MRKGAVRMFAVCACGRAADTDEACEEWESAFAALSARLEEPGAGEGRMYAVALATLMGGHRCSQGQQDDTVCEESLTRIVAIGQTNKEAMSQLDALPNTLLRLLTSRGLTPNVCMVCIHQAALNCLSSAIRCSDPTLMGGAFDVVRQIASATKEDGHAGYARRGTRVNRALNFFFAACHQALPLVCTELQIETARRLTELICSDDVDGPLKGACARLLANVMILCREAPNSFIDKEDDIPYNKEFHIPFLDFMLEGTSDSGFCDAAASFFCVFRKHACLQISARDGRLRHFMRWLSHRLCQLSRSDDNEKLTHLAAIVSEIVKALTHARPATITPLDALMLTDSTYRSLWSLFRSLEYGTAADCDSSAAEQSSPSKLLWSSFVEILGVLPEKGRPAYVDYSGAFLRRFVNCCRSGSSPPRGALSFIGTVLSSVTGDPADDFVNALIAWIPLAQNAELSEVVWVIVRRLEASLTSSECKLFEALTSALSTTITSTDAEPLRLLIDFAIGGPPEVENKKDGISVPAPDAAKGDNEWASSEMLKRLMKCFTPRKQAIGDPNIVTSGVMNLILTSHRLRPAHLTELFADGALSEQLGTQLAEAMKAKDRKQMETCCQVVHSMLDCLQKEGWQPAVGSPASEAILCLSLEFSVGAIEHQGDKRTITSCLRALWRAVQLPGSAEEDLMESIMEKNIESSQQPKRDTATRDVLRASLQQLSSHPMAETRALALCVEVAFFRALYLSGEIGISLARRAAAMMNSVCLLTRIAGLSLVERWVTSIDPAKPTSAMPMSNCISHAVIRLRADSHPAIAHMAVKVSALLQEIGDLKMRMALLHAADERSEELLSGVHDQICSISMSKPDDSFIASPLAALLEGLSKKSNDDAIHRQNAPSVSRDAGLGPCGVPSLLLEALVPCVESHAQTPLTLEEMFPSHPLDEYEESASDDSEEEDEPAIRQFDNDVCQSGVILEQGGELSGGVCVDEEAMSDGEVDEEPFDEEAMIDEEELGIEEVGWDPDWDWTEDINGVTIIDKTDGTWYITSNHKMRPLHGKHRHHLVTPHGRHSRMLSPRLVPTISATQAAASLQRKRSPTRASSPGNPQRGELFRGAIANKLSEMRPHSAPMKATVRGRDKDRPSAGASLQVQHRRLHSFPTGYMTLRPSSGATGRRPRAIDTDATGEAPQRGSHSTGPYSPVGRDKGVRPLSGRLHARRSIQLEHVQQLEVDANSIATIKDPQASETSREAPYDGETHHAEEKKINEKRKVHRCLSHS
ncbi:unnamed protein product [Vitrella brassicaformis CCMP3155]|uniref:Uncharacterized protein n=2 Tax=Vitrella brassicaformis TaxID=1169539 RepID=A0A0G4EB13_VITBC|nr:unnamed protein product [Vitrella brassicaformis CCMP3155]|eukprot:CEL93124.1 unnamed protein product [Vitrella brassicaformis CCMP3155]